MSRNDNDEKNKWGVREKCAGTFSRQELISIFSAPQKVVVTKSGHEYATSSLPSQQDTQQQMSGMKK